MEATEALTWHGTCYQSLCHELIELTVVLAKLINDLSQPAAYPFPVDRVEVRQTHISVVFLAGDRAFKIKKAVEMGFLDFRTLERRRHFCEEEVRLNRRLAAHVYLGVIPVTMSATGCRIGGAGEPVEWAVEMLRLPEDAKLERSLVRDELTVERLKAIAARIAEFHCTARSGPEVAAFGRFEVVAENARENFVQTLPHIGTTVSAVVFERLRSATAHSLELLQPLIEQRAKANVPRDTHGDLHLDHVYLFPDEPPPKDITIIDCIEFSNRFRFADPVADMAFLAMDLKDHGRYDLARAFADAYFTAAGDDEGRALLPLYVAYRSVVRAKVEGFKLAEPEIPAEARRQALERARGHWLLALGELSKPDERPCLLLVGGLPGTGKSTLAQLLAEQHGFDWIRSDVVRKELIGLKSEPRTPEAFRAGLYSPEMTTRTYEECRKRTEQLLWKGKRVVVDANFPTEALRLQFLGIADRLCVPVWFVHCIASPANVQVRLQRRIQDASDADWSIYQKASQHWESLGPAVRRVTLPMSTDADRDVILPALSVWLRTKLSEL